MLPLLRKANNFHLDPTKVVPFQVNGETVGWIRRSALPTISKEPDLLVTDAAADDAAAGDGDNVEKDFGRRADRLAVTFASHIQLEAQRTRSVEEMLLRWRDEKIFPCLEGWRNEQYPVYSKTGQGTGLLGVRRFGCHLNGFHKKDPNGLTMWIARRSSTKQTYPNMLDNLVGGGLPSTSRDPFQNLIKECKEEAGMEPELANLAVPVGAISFFHDCPKRGLLPDTEYIFDLELPADFEPVAQDGEVQAFYQVDMDELKRRLLDREFTPEAGLVVIDFLLRHGIIRPETEPDYLTLLTGLHDSLLGLPGPGGEAR